MPNFYRVLYPRVMAGDQILDHGTLQRWLDHRYTSTHSRVPGPWRVRWDTDQSTNPQDYPLCCEDVEYTTEAREAFLQFAPQYGDTPIWPEDIRNRTGEYVGVSAFDTPQAALDYAQGPPKLFVVFEGNAIAPLGPEGDQGGYRVRVIAEIADPMHRDDFVDWVHQHPDQA